MSIYLDYLKQIDELTKKAEAARREERGAAIADIKTKVKAFNLTADDLGLGERAPRRGRRPAATKTAAGAARPTGRKRKASPMKGVKRKIKYRGPEGQLWSGVGRKPGWVIAALAAGRSIKEFSIVE
jgi:DNA-binding protein H-NS